MTTMGHIRGEITGKHFFTQAPEIIRDYGWKIWLRGIWAIVQGQDTTFLALINKKKK